MASLAAIGLAYHAHGAHCGVYYEAADGIIELLHLAAHNGLSSEPESEYYLNIETRFPPFKKVAVSNLCRLFYNRYGASRALRYSAARTDSILTTGELAIDKPGVGLTCATLVIQLFERNGADLIDKKSWPPASLDDRVWLRTIVKIFQNAFRLERDVLHFENIDDSCKWSRFLPEEVAAAAMIAPPSAKRSELRKSAPQILRDLKATHKPLPTPQTNRAGAVAVPSTITLRPGQAATFDFVSYSGHIVVANSTDPERVFVSPEAQAPTINNDGTLSARFTVTAGKTTGTERVHVTGNHNEQASVAVTVNGTV